MYGMRFSLYACDYKFLAEICNFAVDFYLFPKILSISLMFTILSFFMSIILPFILELDGDILDRMQLFCIYSNVVCISGMLTPLQMLIY